MDGPMDRHITGDEGPMMKPVTARYVQTELNEALVSDMKRELMKALEEKNKLRLALEQIVALPKRHAYAHDAANEAIEVAKQAIEEDARASLRAPK